MFKSIKRIIILILVVIIFAIGYFVKDGYNLYKEALNKTSLEIRVKNLKETDGYVKLEDINKDYLNAVISVEDKRFYEHCGVDLYAIGGALVYNFQNKKFAFGGSTISQQLAKNLCLDQRRNLSRKVAEIFATKDIEEKYNKNDILEMYVNISYFGDGYYGIGNASKGYFQKNPNEINLDEATLLAGLPNAPSIFQLSNNNKATYKRQIIVIESMIKNGYLDESTAKELIIKIKDKNKI